MKIARFLITPVFMRELFHLPVTAEIVWAGWRDGCIELTVEHADLKDVVLSPDELPPVVQPKFRKQESLVMVEWGQ